MEDRCTSWEPDISSRRRVDVTKIEVYKMNSKLKLRLTYLILSIIAAFRIADAQTADIPFEFIHNEVVIKLTVGW